MDESKIVYGKKSTLDALKANNVKEICYHNFFPELNVAINQKVKVTKKDINFFKQLPKNLNHQNIVTYLKESLFEIKTEFGNFIKTINDSNKKRIVVAILDKIQDPGNFGAILRSAKAFGIDGIVYKKDQQAQINPLVVKASQGNLNGLNLLKVANLSNIVEKLKKQNFWILATALHEKSISLDQFENKFEKIAIILGNENKGISSLLLKNADINLNIPMQNDVESINVASCAAILFYSLTK